MKNGFNGINLLCFIRTKSVVSWSKLWKVRIYIAIPRAKMEKITIKNVVKKTESKLKWKTNKKNYKKKKKKKAEKKNQRNNKKKKYKAYRKQIAKWQT